MASESAVRAWLRRSMRGRLLMEGISDRFKAGVPDTWYHIPGTVHGGWLEVKETTWPKRPGTATALGLTPAQQLYLSRFWAAGAAAYLLARVDEDLLLVPGTYAACWLKQEWYDLSVARWRGYPPAEQLVAALARK